MIRTYSMVLCIVLMVLCNCNTAVQSKTSGDFPSVLKVIYKTDSEDHVLKNEDKNIPAHISQIQIIFDFPMNQSGRSICGEADWIKDSKYVDETTYQLDVHLEKAKSYTIVLNCPSSSKGFRNQDGVALSYFTLTFYTEGIEDCPEPNVTKVTWNNNGEEKNIIDGNTNIPPSVHTMTISFSHPMNDAGRSLCGDTKWIKESAFNDEKTLVLQTDLEPETIYTLFLNCPSSGKHFKSACGMPLNAYQMSFKTMKP